MKAGGGHNITMGQMVRQMMTKLEWYSTLFPRIPVPVEKQIHAHFKEWDAAHPQPQVEEEEWYDPRQKDGGGRHNDAGRDPGGFGEAARVSSSRRLV